MILGLKVVRINYKKHIVRFKNVLQVFILGIIKKDLEKEVMLKRIEKELMLVKVEI